MGASFLYKAVFVFAAFCVFAVSAKQAVPFEPIHPGSIHADRFSPLNGDRVTVDPFVANEGLSAFVLDFGSLTAKSEVNIDLKGGANFNNFNFEASGNGPVSVGATTNDLNIEAFRGSFRLASGSLAISGGDTLFESLTGEVYAGISGPATIRTSGLSVNGDYQIGGVSFSSGGSTTFTAGDAFSDRFNASTFFRNGTNNLFPEDDPRFLADLLAMKGNVRFSATNFEVNGEDGLTISKDANGGHLVLTAAQSLDMISGGAMNISAASAMRVLALSGPMDIEAGQFDIQTPFLYYQADGTLSIASVLGRMDISGRTGANVETADQAKFLANREGITIQAGNEVNFLAGDYIDLSSSSNNDTTTSTLSGNNLRVESQLNDVSIDVTGDYDSTVTGNTRIQAGRDLELTAQDSFTVETSNSLAFNIQRNFIMAADNRMNFNGRIGAINFDINDDMFIVTEESANINGEGLIFNVVNDATFAVQTDLTFEADESFSQTFSNLGVFSGEAQVNLTSNGASTIVASDINWQSGDSVRVRANDLTVTTDGGDVTIDSPTFSLYRAKDSSVTGSGSLEILSRGMWSTEAPNFFNVVADENIEMLIDRDGDLYATSSSAKSVSDLEFRTSRDLQLFLQDELVVQNDATVGTTTFTSGDNTRLESADFLAQGNNLEMNANDLYIFARRGFGVGSSGPIVIDASDLAGFVASGDLNVNSGDAASFTAVDDISIGSTDGFFGDILIRSTQGDLRVDVADTTTLFTDRFEVYGGDSIAFQSRSFNLRHTENDPSDFGNFNFTSLNGVLGHRADDLYVVDARTVEMSGTNVNMDSATKLTINAASNGMLKVETVEDIALTAAKDISMSSGVISFTGRNQGRLTAAEWDFASDSLFVNGTDAFNIKSLDDVNFVVDTEFGTLLEDAFSFTAGFISVLADEDLTLYEGGGGTRVNAGTGSYTFTAGDIIANAQERIAFVSKQGSMSVNANNVLTFEGGDQTLTAGTNVDFISKNGVFSASSSDNGYISFKSAKSIISTAAETFTLSPNSPLLASDQGRFGSIRSTPENGNICINTAGTEDNSFNGDSVTFTATDPQGANMTVNADQDMLFLTEDGSIGINAYGFIPTDPQFIFEPSVTFGILFRTMEENFNPIFISADDANVFGFARGKVDIRSVAGGIEALAGVDTDFRTFGRDADIITVAGDDNSIEYFAGGDMTLRAGNDRLNADFKIDSTGDMTFTAEQDIELEHVGPTTDPDYRGLYFTTKGDYLMTAEGGDFAVRATEGGVIDFRTREGSMVFNALLGDVSLSALTGRISTFARGSATFDTVAGPVSILARGDSGSVFVSSGSDELFSINTDSTMSFTSTQGEVDVESSEDFRTISVGDTTFNSFCTNVEGGSVRFNAEDLVQFVSALDIAFDAQVEYTVDADFITYDADQTFRLSAGGTDATPGIIATSVGAITYTSVNDEITFNATNFVVTAAQDVLLSYTNDLTFYSKLDSITQDNIVLTSENGPTLVTANAIRKDATFTQQTTSANMLATITSDISLLANRLLRWDTAETWTNTVTGSYTVSGGDLDADFDDVFVITSTVGDILFDADALLQMDVTGTYTYDAINLQVTTRGDNALVAWNSVDDFTATVTGTFVSDSKGDTQVYAGNDIELAALQNFNANVFDDLRIFSIQDIDFNAVNGLYDGDAESFEFYSNDFIFTASQLSVSTVRFGVNAYESVDIGQTNAFAFVLTGAAGQNARFLADGDIQLVSAAKQTITAANDLLFESESDDGPFTVTASNNLISTPATSFSVTSRRNTFVDSSTLNDIDFTTATFTAKGPGSVNFVATTLPITVAGGTLFESLNGNIILEQTQAATDFTVTSTTGAISVTTTDVEGDILLSSGEGDTAFTAQNFLIQQVDPDLANDSTRSGYGLITFSAEAVNIGASSFLTANAEDNIEASSRRTTTTYSGATVTLSAGELVNLEAQNTMTVTSGGTTSFSASGSGFSLIRGHSNDITLRADGAITYTSTTEFEARSEGSLLINGGTSLAVVGEHSHITAQDEDFKLTSNAPGTFTWDATPFIIMEATGHESLFDLHPTTMSLTATRATYIDADETFAGAFTNVVSTGTFVASSAHDQNFVVQNNGVITFTAQGITFRAIDDGNIIANVAGDMAATSTAGDINFRAQGMLGALGGRYVLEDQYWLPAVTQDQRHRINRNTFGIEVTNNDGDVNVIAANTISISADQGSVELRATRAIRYIAPNPTGNIRFFGIGQTTSVPGVGTPPQSPPSGGVPATDINNLLVDFNGAALAIRGELGVLPLVPFAFDNDYCNNRQCESGGVDVCNVTCPDISRVINEITRALVRYGLLDCGGPAAVGAGFCVA